jgi:hypothetical protein
MCREEELGHHYLCIGIARRYFEKPDLTGTKALMTPSEPEDVGTGGQGAGAAVREAEVARLGSNPEPLETF